MTFGHHLLAWFEMLSRDHERLVDCRKRVNRMPLGSAALAGTTYPIQRQVTCELLGFEAIGGNSLDGVSDRDFAIEFCAAASLAMMHLSRFSEELVLWTSAQFQFIDLPDRFCTAPRSCRRRRTPTCPSWYAARPAGCSAPSPPADPDEGPAAGLQQGQPGRQGTAVRRRRYPARLPARLRRHGPGIKPKREIMREAARRGFSTATDLADYLVRKGLPFRDCHEIVGHAVKYGVDSGKDLAEMSLDELRRFSDQIEQDVFAVLTLEGSVNARDHMAVPPGPGPRRRAARPRAAGPALTLPLRLSPTPRGWARTPPAEDPTPAAHRPRQRAQEFLPPPRRRLVRRQGL